MGFGKSFKKHVGKAINTITGGNAALNKVIGIGLAPVSGGASLNVANNKQLRKHRRLIMQIRNLLHQLIVSVQLHCLIRLKPIIQVICQTTMKMPKKSPTNY